MNTATFYSYISASLAIKRAEKPMSGHFIQWGNSFILDREVKIPMTVALVRTTEGSLFLANPLELQFHNK